MSNLNPITSTATAIADQLGETVGGARATIWRIVRTIGPERVQGFVAQALEVEANGGMLIPMAAANARSAAFSSPWSARTSPTTRRCR